MEKLLILDTSAMIYRAHFAMQNLINSKGVFTGATFGFVKKLDSAIKEINPKYIAAALDIKRSELKRVEFFKDYKANRKSMPEVLKDQLDGIKDIIKYYGISSFAVEGYEADDVIGSLTKFGVNNGLEVHIITGDKDIQQLVTDDENVHIHFLSKDISVKNREEVKEVINVYPEQIPDFFGIMGDSSDGIPGIKGIGVAGATKLIEAYSNLENLYEHIDETKGKLKEKLINDKEIAFISRKLAIINTDIDLGISLSDLEFKPKNTDKLIDLFKELELNSLISNISKEIDVEFIECSFEELSEKISKNLKSAIFLDDNFFSCYFGEKVYIHSLVKEETLFSTKTDFTTLKLNDIVIYNAKEYLNEGFNFKNFFDVLIAAYVVNTQDEFDIESLAKKYLSIDIPKLDKKALKKASLKELRDISYKKCYAIFKLEPILKEKLKELDVKDTYTTIEKPIISVLSKMETRGIKIDTEEFARLNKHFSSLVEEKAKKIYELAGCEFNIDSPMQLSEILFEKMQIKGERKNKRFYSTDAEVLELLSLKGIEIAKHLLEYRAYKKLLSTYIEPLPTFADNDSRIHSSFNATGTATGRLSSLNPNLQNIPTRTEEGSMIRNCFIAEKGKKLVSFDYSQIELRVLAELSGDEALIDAYNKDLDLHTLTAKKLFKSDNIDKIQRNIAKIINFSVLYGKTPFGLSKELKISVSDAKKYIDTYFEQYKGVPIFIDNIIDNAINNLYVETLFGTRRFIPEIKANNLRVFEQAKRMAINTVIQGTAANIIKLVMIELDKKGYNMLIQVHDELIFELDEDKAEEKSLEIKEIMEETIKFKKVKLKVNYEIADRWGDLK